LDHIHKVVLIEGLDCIVPGVQQFIFKFLAENEDMLRFVFTLEDPKMVIEKLHKRCDKKVAKLKKLTHSTYIRKILRTLQEERMGYEKDAMRALLKIAHGDLSTMFRLLQQIHQKYDYISEVNVRKFFPQSIPDPEVDMHTVLLAPDELTGKMLIVPRCPVTTLAPPTKYITIDDCTKMAEIRREQLPRGKGSGVPTCPQWRDHGYCTAFNLRGRCMYEHPLGIHKVMPVLARCPLTTLEADASCQHVYPHALRWLDGRVPEDIGHSSKDPKVRATVEKYEKQKRRQFRKLDGQADWDRDSDEDVDEEQEMLRKKKEAEAKKARKGKGKARGTARADAKALPGQKQLALPSSPSAGKGSGATKAGKGDATKGKKKGQKGEEEEEEPQEKEKVKTDPSGEVRAPWFNHKRRSRWAMTHEASRD
jgi:hypothetical protein